MKKIYHIFLLSTLLLGLYACSEGTLASETIKSSVQAHEIQLLELQKLRPDGKAETISDIAIQRISYHNQFLAIDSTEFFNLARLSRYSIDKGGAEAKLVLVLD